jgi:hypothetical protein
MRKSIFLTALVLPLAALAADSNTFQLRDAQDLVSACSTPADDPQHGIAVGFCHGVLVGAYGYYDATTKADGRFICPPTPTPTRAKVMNDFVAWATSRPQYMKDRPLDTLFRYLGETYPCKK